MLCARLRCSRLYLTLLKVGEEYLLGLLYNVPMVIGLVNYLALDTNRAHVCWL